MPPSIVVSLDGGSYASGTITATDGQTATVRLDNAGGLGAVRIELRGYPPGWSTPAGWSLDADSRTIYFDGTEPPDFDLTPWGKWFVRLLVDGILVDKATAIEVESPDGLHALPAGEEGQFGGEAEGWGKHLEENLRTLQTLIATVAGLSSLAAALYGDGSDGALEVLNGQTYEPDQDKFFSSIIVRSGGRLRGKSFRIFCSGVCTVESGGSIDNDGTAGGNDGNVAAVVPAGTLAGGQGQGGAGAAAPNGSGGVNPVNPSMGGAGGSANGGAGGTVTAPVLNRKGIRALPFAVVGAACETGTWYTCFGGAGGRGGSGGNAGTGFNGSGGSGGGWLVLCARIINNQGRISANGGAGGAAAATNGNGGGGGGGGVCAVVSSSYTGNEPEANGGLGGAGNGSGVAGSQGGVGTMIKLAA